MDLNSKKNDICEFFGLKKELSSFFEIIGYNPDEEIFTLHYIKELLSTIRSYEGITDEEINTIKSFRGLTVSLNQKLNINKSFGFTNNIEIENFYNLDNCYNQIGENLIVNIEDCIFKKCYDGSLIKITFYGDEVIFSTNKSYIAKDSRWGSSKCFGLLFCELFFRQLNGSYENESLSDLRNILFSSDKTTSNFTHTFLMTHPSLVIASQKDYGLGKVYFIQTFQNNDEVFDIENTETTPKWGNHPDFSVKELTIDEARENFEGGEDVICDWKIGTPEHQKLRLIPQQSTNRLKVLNNSSNLYERYLKEVHQMKDDQLRVEFCEKLTSCCPFHKKDEVSKYFEKYQNDLKTCSEILIRDYDVLLLKINENILVKEEKYRKGKELNSLGKTIERIIRQTSVFIKKNGETKKADSINHLIKGEKNIYQLLVKISK
jgi:hypothetical protein